MKYGIFQLLIVGLIIYNCGLIHNQFVIWKYKHPASIVDDEIKVPETKIPSEVDGLYFGAGQDAIMIYKGLKYLINGEWVYENSPEYKEYFKIRNNTGFWKWLISNKK